MAFIKGKYDIGFLRSNGTDKVGLMLARDPKTNAPIYKSYDDEYLSQQFSTGEPGYSNLPPEKELALVRSDWRGGFGQEYDSDASKYYSSIGADLRFKGMAILGGLAGSIAMPTIPAAAIVNADMELTTGWITQGSRSSNQAHAGTYSWQVTATIGAIEATQILSWNAKYQNLSFTFTCWAWAAAASVAKIGINDGISSTYSDFHTGDSTWQQLSVTKVLATTATQLQLLLYAANPSNPGSDQCYFDDAVITHATTYGACTVMCKFNSAQYFGIGSGLYKLNGTGDGFTFVKNFSATITDLEVFGANMYIALGYSTAYQYMNTSEGFTVSSLANNTAKYFKTLKATADTLYESDTANTLRSTTNPVNGGTAWSAQTTVDSSTYSICELISRSNVLYIRKQDRPFYLDTSGNVQVLVEDTAFLTNSADGKKSTILLDDLIMPWGDQSLLRWDTEAGVPEWLDPSDFCTNLSEFVGAVQATSADERYAYAIVDYSTKLEVLAGRTEEVNGETTWRWHPIGEITLTGAQTAYVSNVYKKRLWITSTSSSDSIYYIPLTTKYGDITNDTNYTFGTGGYFISSWHHLNFKADTKAFIKMTCTTGACTANIYWTAAYQKLGDSSWTTIGNFVTSPTQTIYIPVDASANKPKSTMMRFKFTGTTNDTSKTPKLLSYDVRAILYPTNRRIIDCEVICANSIDLSDGMNEKGQAATIKAAIEEARAATYPVAFYDVGWAATADTLNVKFLPTTSVLTTKNKNEPLERHYRLLLQVTPLS